MTGHEGWGEPVNTEGIQYHAIEKITVFEWHTEPDGKGEPSEVHLWFEMEDGGHPLVMRFHSRPAVDELIVALMTHSKAVWP
jgi:hypothetical protein